MNTTLIGKMMFSCRIFQKRFYNTHTLVSGSYTAVSLRFQPLEKCAYGFA